MMKLKQVEKPKPEESKAKEVEVATGDESNAM